MNDEPRGHALESDRRAAGPARPRNDSRRLVVLAVGSILVTSTVVATELAADRAVAEILDNIHWTLAYATAAIVTYLGYREASGATRTARGWFTVGAVAMTVGQLIWWIQIAVRYVPFPGPSDVFFACVGPTFLVGLGTQIRSLPAPARSASALDALGITMCALTLTMALYFPFRGEFGVFGGLILVSYPALHVGAAGIAAVILLARRIRIRALHVCLVASLAVLGVCWMIWNLMFLENALEQGVLVNYGFSYAMLAFGHAASEWNVDEAADPSLERRYYLVSSSIPLFLVLVAALGLVFANQLGLVTYIVVRISVVLVVVIAAVRQSLLLRERDRALAAERQARELEERFRQIAETIDDVFVIRELASATPTYVGPAFERIWGRSASELLDGTIDFVETLHPDDRALYRRERIETDACADIEYRIRRPDGTTRIVRDRRMRLGASEARRVAGMLEDVTEARLASARTAELQAKLAKSERLQAIGTLAGGIAHDFNNILAAVIGNAEVVASSVPESGRPRVAIEGILAASERAKSLVHRMLAFARVEDVGARPVQVEAVAEEVLTLLRPVVPSPVALRVDASAALPPVLVDPTQLHQVLVNLVTNASHAIGLRNGTIRIDISETWTTRDAVAGLAPGHYVALTVEDDGKGMDEATRTRIFDPFFTTKAPGEGTGLGLSVAHAVVTGHGGVIDVESEVGRGTTFRIFLPVSEGERPAREPSETRAPIPVLSLAREVLVVDDDEMVLESTILVVTSLGVRTRATTSPDTALALVRAEPDRYALVVTDMTMPGMMGDELAKAIKAVAPDLPVVVVSGNAVSIEPGIVAEVLPKPFTRRALAEVVARRARSADPLGASRTP